jgi:site-specific DNA-methyltransferase (cytosine-N4-specific)
VKNFHLSEKPFYSTEYGRAFLGDSLKLMRKIQDDSIDLIFTSPPYALHFKKEYGNKNQHEYVDWFLGFGAEFLRILKPTGSLVIDIGGSWQQGKPTRSLYHFELLLRLCKETGFYLAQECYWYNPAKLPAPAEWVTVQRIRIKDSVNCLWWLSKTPNPKASNLNVLTPYSPDMLRLLKRGYKAKLRPSGHNITSGFSENHGGAIPANLLIYGNNDSNGQYLEMCKKTGIKPHPARFPVQLPTFFIRMLTEQNDVVLDPFAGSNTTGEACEREKRKWIAIELEEQYLKASKFRFKGNNLAPLDLANGKKNSKQQPLFAIG